MTDKPRIDVHKAVTDALIAQIEASPGTWELPWARPGIALTIPKNITGRSYNGINILSLWCAALDKGYTHHLWGTHRQWSDRKAQVRKGERASLVVLFKDFNVDVENADTGEIEQETRLFARASLAFNVAQVDTIHMPERSAFHATAFATPTENFYSTLCHELTHYTGVEKRLNRQLGKRFGDDQYAMEELVAELGAAFLAAELGITPTPRADHAQYLSHWMMVLRADSRAIFTAAAAASKAVAYLNGLQPKLTEVA